MKVCYLYDEERLVYEGEGWGIIIDDMTNLDGDSRGFSEAGCPVYATHAECTVSYNRESPPNEDGAKTYGECCWDVSMTPQCTVCKEQVPSSIQTLVALQSWDK